MSDNGKESYSALAKELNVSDETVRRTVKGTLHSTSVLDWLRAHGVPESYLCDPRYM
nr:MAG TPA: LAMBDA REPRESSOR (TRIPLE MUTANT)/DNA COMPLEX-DNA COMPLEX, DOUBLE HELIX, TRANSCRIPTION-DNA.1A [Caudoviricetes sp.]